MPETPEIETDKLDENIHEELERAGGSLLKATVPSTCTLRSLGGGTGLCGAGQHRQRGAGTEDRGNTAASQPRTIGRLTQAKGIKARRSRQASSRQDHRAAANSRDRHLRWMSASATPAAGCNRAASRTKKEAERDKKFAEGDHHLHLYHRSVNSVALFQVAIALGAVAALTRVRPRSGVYR